MEKGQNCNQSQNFTNSESDFKMPECAFAAVCGSCYYNDGGWCRKHGGHVDADKWACGDYA